MPGYGSNHIGSPLRLDFHRRQLKLPLLKDALIIPGIGIGLALGVVEGSLGIRVDVCFVRRFRADSRAGTKAKAENGWASAQIC